MNNDVSMYCYLPVLFAILMAIIFWVLIISERIFKKSEDSKIVVLSGFFMTLSAILSVVSLLYIVVFGSC